MKQPADDDVHLLGKTDEVVEAQADMFEKDLEFHVLTNGDDWGEPKLGHRRSPQSSDQQVLGLVAQQVVYQEEGERKFRPLNVRVLVQLLHSAEARLVRQPHEISTVAMIANHNTRTILQ